MWPTSMRSALQLYLTSFELTLILTLNLHASCQLGFVLTIHHVNFAIPEASPIV